MCLYKTAALRHSATAKNHRREPAPGKRQHWKSLTAAFPGFEFPVQLWDGAEGNIENCIILNPGHCGITIGHGSSGKVSRNIVSGSRYHAIRCTGGKIEADSNLLIRNRNRGFYIGNRSAVGTLSNNLIVENGIGISIYARSKMEIMNNVILRCTGSGISIIDTADIEIEDNIIAENKTGVTGFSAEKGKEADISIDGKNLLYENATESQDADLPSKTITKAPEFSDPDAGLFKSSIKSMGLTAPNVLQELWKKWQAALDQ